MSDVVTVPGDSQFIADMEFTNGKDGGSADVLQAITLIADYAEMIYLMCFHCDNVSLPQTWKGQLLFVQGKAGDKCVNPMANPREEDWYHGCAGTANVKFAVLHAKLHGFKNIMLTEADFSFETNQQKQYPELKHNWSSVRDTLKRDWDVVHLGWIYHKQCEYKVDVQCHPNCVCHRISQGTCETGRCLLMGINELVSRGAYDPILATQGFIDEEPMAAPAGNRVVLFPPIISEKRFVDSGWSSMGWLAFNEQCANSSMQPTADR